MNLLIRMTTDDVFVTEKSSEQLLKDLETKKFIKIKATRYSTNKRIEKKDFIINTQQILCID